MKIQTTNLNLILTVFLTVAVGSGIFSSIQLQNTQDKAQRDTERARTLNANRQEEIKSYIKCIILLKYEEPPIADTKVAVDTALDKCATLNKDPANN